jgi:multiple sugar transport system substrate-binding protein
MNNKNALNLLGLALTVSLLVAGCGPSDSEPEDGVLRVWSTWAGSPAQLQVLFDRYGQESGLPVKVTAGVRSDKVLKALSGPTPPDVVILSSSDPVKSYYEQGLVEPLGPWMKATGIDPDDIYPASLAQCETPDGTYLCLPWGGDVYALFWNKDLFQAAGLDPERPPQTMEELAEYADRLTVRDDKGELVQIGFVPDFSRSHADLYARMFGGSWYGDDGAELTANSRPMIDAANWQRQFYARYGTRDVEKFVSSFNLYTNSSHPVYAGKRLDCQQCHRNAPRKKGPDRGFYTGKVAMAVEGEWQVGPNYISRLEPGLNYGVAPFPPPADHPERANTALVQGAVAILPAGIQDKEEAAELLAWMMSPEIVAEEMASISGLPTSRVAARDPRFRQIPGFAVFMDLLAHPNANSVVTTPISPELNEALGQVEEKVLHKGSDPAPLLDEVQVEFASRVEEALGYHDGP